MTAKVPAKRPDKRLRIKGKLKLALDRMIWGDADGIPEEWDAAARAVDFSTAAMRKALGRPHVRAYLKAERYVLKAALSARNVRRLQDVADGPNQAARVRAIQVMEALDEHTGPGGPGGPVQRAPGVTIIVQSASPAPQLPPSARPSPLLTIEHPMMPSQRVDEADRD